MALIKDETHTSRKNANIGQLGSVLVVEVGKLVAQIVYKRLNITYERLMPIDYRSAIYS